MTFIAVDPGGACLAWAVFRDGVLVAAGLHRVKEKDTFARAQLHQLFISELKAKWHAELVLSEAMWYVRRRGARPQDIVNLNLIAGAVADEWVLPHVWKGKLPKEVHHPRVWATLREDEKEIARGVMPEYLRHNSTDAIGIGLYRLRRLTPCTILPSLPSPPPASTSSGTRKGSSRTTSSSTRRRSPKQSPKRSPRWGTRSGRSSPATSSPTLFAGTTSPAKVRRGRTSGRSLETTGASAPTASARSSTGLSSKRALAALRSTR